MRVAIYTPYLDTAGGGEKYMLTIAETLSKENLVDVLLDSHLINFDQEQIRGANEKRHDLDLSKVNFIQAPIGVSGSFFKKLSFLKQYDLLFYNTDGSIFYSTAKKGIIHFQMPFEPTAIQNYWGKMKLKSWKMAIYNSKFTKEFIESKWPIRGEVVYPPVDIENFKKGKKIKQIVSVGRFFSLTQVKKHEVMIDAFKRLIDTKKASGWNLVLAGGADEGNYSYVEELKQMAKGYPIEIKSNIPLKDLIALYSESAIYWHAMGYGESDPAMFEHFGITTVEAMASGCVPVVIAKGGQPEIVEEWENGFLWDDLDQLQEKTLKLIGDAKLMDKLSDNAVKRSKDFSKEIFEEKIMKVTNG